VASVRRGAAASLRCRRQHRTRATTPIRSE
jgi:hypothetical protein